MLKYINVDPKIKCKTADLIAEPIVIRVRQFTEEAVEKFSENISKAHETGQTIIPVVVDSYGGECYGLFSMISEIQNSKLPVATIMEGKAMSAGGILFSFGTEGYRYMASNATMMIHEVSSGSYGKVEEIKADSEETDRINTLIFKLMAKNCGHPENYFLNIVHERRHADWYLTAKEAKKHNLANYIRVPEFRVDVSVAMTLA